MKNANVNVMHKSAPRFVDETHVLVTKEFAKNAMIFGTAEYRLWREIRKDVPKAEMVTKTIRKNPDKQTSTRNMTYENMAAFIRQQESAAVLMAEFQREIAISKVQTNPYRCVLAWFCQKFQNYDSYKVFFAEAAKEVSKRKDIFRLIENNFSIEGGAAPKGTSDSDAEYDDEFDQASGL